MASTHNVVVIGASFGGLPTAHGLLKDVFPKLSGKSYKLTLINPTDEFLFKIGTPRTVANPTLIPLDQALINFLPTFTKYGDKFEFVQAYATSIDPASQTVTTSTNAAIHYDSLVIASGTSFASDLWHTTSGSDKIKTAYKQVHEALPTAKTILIAGGGPVGVETAGEFGDAYGKEKEITLLSGTEGLLNRLSNKNVGKDAQSRLEKQGVKVLNDNIRVSDIKTDNTGKSVLTLSNGEIKTVDIYINATGDKPNSSFVPPAWLTEKSQVKTDPHTLRLAVDGVSNVYCVGTVASYSDGAIVDTKLAVKPLLYTIQLDLEGAESGSRSKNVYSKIQAEVQFVPVGPYGGVGTAFGVRVPSLAIRFFKARDFMIGSAVKLINGTP